MIFVELNLITLFKNAVFLNQTNSYNKFVLIVKNKTYYFTETYRV